MKTTKITTAPVSNVSPAHVSPDLQEMFAKFLAFQASQVKEQPVAPVKQAPAKVAKKAPVKLGKNVGSELIEELFGLNGTAHATAAKVAEKVAKKAPVKVSAPAAKVNGVHIHKLANSFFVYGEGAPAKLADFFAKKPHLFRGFKSQEINGRVVSAHWFGGKQLPKIEKILATK